MLTDILEKLGYGREAKRLRAALVKVRDEVEDMHQGLDPLLQVESATLRARALELDRRMAIVITQLNRELSEEPKR